MGEKSDVGVSVADDKITMKKYIADEVAMEVESSGGLLVLSDLYYPGWKVKVNGQQETIVRAFGLFKGVFIKGGGVRSCFIIAPLVFMQVLLFRRQPLLPGLVFL